MEKFKNINLSFKIKSLVSGWIIIYEGEERAFQNMDEVRKFLNYTLNKLIYGN